MQQLAVKINLSFNALLIKSVFSSLSKLIQEASSLAEGNSSSYTEIATVFYLKTSSPVNLTLTKEAESFTLTVLDCCLLTDSYDTIEVENVTASTTAEVFVVYS